MRDDLDIVDEAVEHVGHGLPVASHLYLLGDDELEVDYLVEHLNPVGVANELSGGLIV